MGCVVATERPPGAPITLGKAAMAAVVAAFLSAKARQGGPSSPSPPPGPRVPYILHEPTATVGARVPPLRPPGRAVVFLFGGARSYKGVVADMLHGEFGFAILQLEDVLLTWERERAQAPLSLRDLPAALGAHPDLSWVRAAGRAPAATRAGGGLTSPPPRPGRTWYTSVLRCTSGCWPLSTTAFSLTLSPTSWCETREGRGKGGPSTASLVMGVAARWQTLAELGNTAVKSLAKYDRMVRACVRAPRGLPCEAAG